ALVRLLPALLEQLALEQERARDVVGGALDAHRVALARRAPVAGARQAGRSRGLLPAADGAQQRAVADEVGVAADRRGEVAVVREPEPGVAEVRRVVARLLERAQHEAAQADPALAGARDVLLDEPRTLGDRLGRLLRREAIPPARRRRRDVERGELRDEPL